MKKGFLLVFMCAFSAPAVHASNLIDLGSYSCSAGLSFDAGNGLSVSCSGDFSLTGGILSSDTSINLTALGDLTLDAFSLSAPNITISAANLNFAPNVVLSGQTVNINGYGPIVNTGGGAGGVITIGARGTLENGSIVIAGGGTGRSITISGEIQLPPATIVATPPSSLNISSGGDVTIGSRELLTAGTIQLDGRTIDSGLLKLGSGGILTIQSPPPSLTILPEGGLSILAGTLNVTSVPLPATFSLWLGGLLMLASGLRARATSPMK